MTNIQAIDLLKGIECRIHAFNTEAQEWLSEKVLDSPVHMMDAEDDAIRISLYWDK